VSLVQTLAVGYEVLGGSRGEEEGTYGEWSVVVTKRVVQGSPEHDGSVSRLAIRTGESHCYLFDEFSSLDLPGLFALRSEVGERDGRVLWVGTTSSDCDKVLCGEMRTRQ
jgi:hypothetical protein